MTSLKAHLHRHNVNDFKSLKEVIDFRNSYATYRQEIISQHEKLIEQEKTRLPSNLLELETTIEDKKLQLKRELHEEIDNLKQELNSLTTSAPANYIQRLTNPLKKWYYKRKIHYKENSVDFKVRNAIKDLVNLQQEKNNRYQFIISHFHDAVIQSGTLPLTELERKKRVIEEARSFIYGALGEQKVVKELENLSDEYFLINDFSISFSTPIYNRQENDYIKSIQIDHILISPSGIFLIETKNWSEKSLENFSLRSPVEQVKRTSFVLFKLLNNEMANYHLHLDRHHWGIKKISIRNLIVLTKSKPKEEFQHVKTLTLNELTGYVQYFKPTFSNIEAQRITDYLVNINNQKTIAVNRNRKSYGRSHIWRKYAALVFCS